MKNVLELRMKEGDNCVSLQLWNDNAFIDDLIGTVNVMLTDDGFLAATGVDNDGGETGGGTWGGREVLLGPGERGKIPLSSGGVLDCTLLLIEEHKAHISGDTGVGAGTEPGSPSPAVPPISPTHMQQAA